uniref:Uncharacterized protein n=1 Tax=Phytophthora ramorum TaxID=164328 RepID=H3GYL0_PHYRM
MDYSDAKEDDLEEKAAIPELSEAAAVSAGRSGGVRSLARNLTEELNEVAGPEPANGYDEDESDDHRSSAMAEDANSRPNGSRPPLNGDTPAANRVLGRYLELMKVKSNWMRSFAPEVVRQAIWMELSGELTVPVESWSTRQVAEDTVQLLRAMGCEPQVFPSEADLRAWAPEDAATALRKWKQKLWSAFGVAEAGSAKARYYSAKREEKEHVCDYLNRLNGYARNAGVQFEHGGRDAKDHVEHFLDSCEDRGLEEHLCHVRVKNIHDLEDMINDILRRRERKSGRESSVRCPREQEVARRRDGGHSEDPRDGYRRDRRHREDDRRREDRYRDDNRRRDDQQYRPRVTLTDALTNIVTALNAGRSADTRGGYPEAYNGGYGDTEEYGPESHSGDDDRYSEGYSDDGYASTEDRGHVAAANDTERRNAAEGTFARADNRRPRASNGQRPYDRDDQRRNSTGRDGRRQYGPCAACGGLTHSAHYCFKRCKMCKQVHDAGKFFMIPAGVRLDLFHGTARLPDEVMVPLVKSQNPAEAEPYSMQVTGRPTEDLSVPGQRDRMPFMTTMRSSDEPVGGSWVGEDDDSVATDTSDGADTTYTSEEDSIPVLGDDPETRLDSAFVAMMHEITTGDGSGGENTDTETSEHLANEIELTDYAHELAFLPDLTEASETVLDYSGPNVLNPRATARQQESLVAVLKRHEKIMIASGNALPPPAYGVVCDIDVQGHPPIKQRARRTPLRHLRKLYELLKGLLKAHLVAFSDSPWASPIVIVLKKNGVDIRLCINYKLVNAVTAIMEYAMPLVDDLLTDLEAYLWFCSLDAASGFWAIMMTMRARKVSAFVCALGHFEWLRMPFGLKNAPMIYQRMIDNALWGFVQPKGGWLHFSELMRTAEAHAEVARTGVTDPSLRRPEESTTRPTKFEADRESSVTLDAVNGLVNSPVADMFSTGEPDESLLVPVFDRRSFIDDICFGSETFDACLETLDRLLQRFTECRISVSFTKSIFVQPKVDFLSHEVSAEGIRADTKKMKAVTELPFPASKKGMQSLLGALNYYSRFIQDFAVYGAALYQLKDEDFTPSGSLSAAKRSFAALQQKVAEAPILRHFDRDKEMHVTLFANEWALSSTLMQYHDDKLHPVRFCGRVLKDAEMNYHPAEKEVLALLLVLKVCYSQLVGRTIHVYTRFSTLEWVHKSKTLFGRATHFAVMLSPWHLVVNRVKEHDCTFAQLLQAGLTSFVELEDSLAPVTPPTKGSPTARMDPHLLYACLPRSYTGFVMSFDGSPKTETNGGYGSCSWILWKLPEWTVVTAASAYLETTTVNLAEYAGMNNGVSAALEHGAEDLVIVGDSRLAIQQSLGVMACRKESLMVQLNRHRELTTKLRSVKYLHVVREFNAAADSLAGEALSSKESSVALTEAKKLELVELNRIGEVIYEPSVQTTAEEKPTVSFARAQVARGTSRDRSFFDFVRDEPDYLTATTRHQAKARKKRVRFADETSVIGPDDAAERDEVNGVTTEAQSELRAEQSSNEADPGAPNAEDVDPVVIQEERRRRISAAQDEELRWSNLKAVRKQT